MPPSAVGAKVGARVALGVLPATVTQPSIHWQALLALHVVSGASKHADVPAAMHADWPLALNHSQPAPAQAVGDVFTTQAWSALPEVTEQSPH